MTKERIVQIAAILLTALLALAAVFGYDLGVIRPREARYHTEILAALQGGEISAQAVSHFREIEVQSLKVPMPTAMGTATPGIMVDSSGVANLLELRKAATPVVYSDKTGALTVQDLTAADDVTVTDDLTVTGLINWSYGEENIGLPSIISTAITYTAATGGTGAVTTIADGEVWFVHAVFINVTTNFAADGDDATLIVGDGLDTDGFCVLADAELQAADTEQTGSPAGWQCLVAATMGVYLDGAVSSAPHIYAPSGAAETIDWLVSETTGDTLSAGAATIYIVYTRIS